MRCSICELTAKYICVSNFSMFCCLHISSHDLLSDSNHSFEPLNIKLRTNESKALKKEVLTKIYSLEKLKEKLFLLSKELIEKVEKCSKQAIQKLDFQIELYLKLASLNCLSISLKKETEKVFSTKLIEYSILQANFESSINEEFKQQFQIMTIFKNDGLFKDKARQQSDKVGNEVLITQQPKVKVPTEEVNNESKQKYKSVYSINKLNRSTLNKRNIDINEIQIQNSQLFRKNLRFWIKLRFMIL